MLPMCSLGVFFFRVTSGDGASSNSNIFVIIPLGFALMLLSIGCCFNANTLAAKRAEVYIVTRTGVAVLTEDYSPPYSCSYTTSSCRGRRC